MGYRLDVFADVGLNEALLRVLIAEHEREALPRLQRLWAYYRNPAEPVGGETRYRLAQEVGLPPRITSPVRDPLIDDRAWKREAVVENDIGWRVQLMVDFMFGKPVLMRSTARRADVRRAVEHVLSAVWEASGGIALLQDMALLGHVYGHADLMLRVRGGAGTWGGRTSAALPPARLDDAETLDRAARLAAERLRVELIEPTRGIPVVNPWDYRRLDAYVVHFERQTNDVALGAGRLLALIRRQPVRPQRRRRMLTEIVSGGARQVYEDGLLLEEEEIGWWTGGDVPVVHIQNVSQPFRYEGLSEVEPLIPLQDELNTRLSDRAARVTMQSFKMYLAKGLDGMEKVPVGPGQVWLTDNPDASVEAFGGDGDSPSEAAHIQDVREAMDKVSGVPPLASGVVRAKIGNLTSANALRITLMGVLARTARKRVTYGGGIVQMCRRILTALDAAGVLPTEPEDRQVKLAWADPLPEDVREQAAAAAIRRELGVPRARVLEELGYEPLGTDAV